MGRNPTGTNRDLNLCISRSVVERLNWEINFLGLESQAYCPDDEVKIRSRSELLAWIVKRFVERSLHGLPADYEPVDLEEEHEAIPFYLNRKIEGTWNIGIRDRLASNYSQLAETALYYHFTEQDAAAERVKKLLESAQAALRHPNPVELRRAIA